MTAVDIERRISGGESATLEFKKSTGQLNRAGETLCAFLNGDGGTVIVGVTPEGRIVGQEVTDRTRREIGAMLGRFEPPPLVEVEYVDLPESGRKLIVLGAHPPADSRPFTFDGRPYWRVETTTTVMPQEQYEALLVERIHGRRRWENQRAEGVEIDDLDHEEILRTVRLGITAGRLPEGTGTDIGEILDRLKLRDNRRVLDAAVVLFTRDPLPDYPQCKLRLARFKGTDKSEFLDNRQVYGHAFHLLEEGMDFLLRHLPISGRFEPGRVERIDEPLFPVAALREALVNALCHRDYTVTGGAVDAAIYDDRLEIWSDGTLPFNQRPQDLKGPHKSRPRNPLITGVFYRRGLVEEWGRGTQMIVNTCMRAGHPEPEFLDEAGAFGVRFLSRGYIAPHRVDQNLTDRQRDILNLVAAGQPIPLRHIVARLASPPAVATVRDDLYHLKRLGLIDSAGRGRGATWRLASPTTE